MPVASALIGPRLAAPVILIIDAVTTVGLVPDAFRRADRREVAVMSLGALVGVPTGVYLLTHLSPLTIRWAIIVICAALLALLLTGWRYHGPTQAAAHHRRRCAVRPVLGGEPSGRAAGDRLLAGRRHPGQHRPGQHRPLFRGVDGADAPQLSLGRPVRLGRWCRSA